MLNLDPAKLIVIFVVALVVLGPERLPQVARQLGSAWRTLTHLREQVTEEVRRAMPEVEIPHLPRPGAVTNFITDLTRPPQTPSKYGTGSSNGASNEASGAAGDLGAADGALEEASGAVRLGEGGGGARGAAVLSIADDDPAMN